MAEFDYFIPPAYHFEKGAQAFRNQDGPESHGLNWHAKALQQWRWGYASAAAKAHNARLAKRYVDIANVVPV